MVVRKQVNNPTDFFDEAFAMYQEGFSANGKFENDKKRGKIVRQTFRRELDWSGLPPHPYNSGLLCTEDYYD